MSSTPIIVVGAGGMGRESLAWTLDAFPDRKILGFCDDAVETDTIVAGFPVLGPVDWVADRDVECVVAIGAPLSRQTVLHRLHVAGAQLRSIVHPSAHIGPDVCLGDGAIVGPNVTLTRDITVGEAAILNFGCQIGHDCRIGDVAFVGPGVSLAGNVTLLEGASIGIGAAIIEGTTVGAWSRIGAGAAVINDIPNNVTAVGVPCRPIANGS